MVDLARRIAAGLIAALLLLQLLSLAGGTGTLPGSASLAVIAIYFVAGFVVARPVLRVVAAIALAGAAGLALRFGMGASLLAGARSAAVFVAFLAAMQMLKVAIELRPAPARDASAPADGGEEHDAMLLRTWLVGSIFAAGTMAIVAPQVGPDRGDDERRRLAQSAVQGVGLALLWSPFFVAMAVCLRLTAGLTLGAALASGTVMSLTGLAISHALFGGRLRLRLLAPLARVFAAMVAMAVAILAIHHAWGLGNLEAIVLLVPPVALVLARRALLERPRAITGRWLVALQVIAGEALLVSASLMFGEVTKDLVAGGVVAMPAALRALPLPLLVAWPAVAMTVLALAGFHPIVGAALLLPLQSALPGLHPVVAAGSVATGWMLALVLSRFSVQVMFAAAMFGVQARGLVDWRAWKFALLFTPTAWAWLLAVNQLVQPASR